MIAWLRILFLTILSSTDQSRISLRKIRRPLLSNLFMFSVGLLRVDDIGQLAAAGIENPVDAGAQVDPSNLVAVPREHANANFS